MERGKQIFSFVGETVAQLAEPRLDSLERDDLVALLHKSIALLRSVSEYSDYAAAVPQDFVRLPHKIIHDVFAIDKQNNAQLQFLTTISGPWGEIGRKRQETTRKRKRSASSDENEAKRMRGAEIFCMVHQLWDRISNLTWQNRDKEDLQVFQRNFNFLTSLAEYSEHLAAIPKDFVALPNEIICDIVTEANSPGILANLNGIWGEMSECVTKKLKSVPWITFDSFQNAKFTLKEARKHSIQHCRIDSNVNFKKLRTAAPTLCRRINFHKAKDIPSDILNRIGNQFTEVEWAVANKDPLKPELIEFFKRQLQSKHLRKLRIDATGITHGVLDDFLSDFVQRPHFESLELYRTMESDSRGEPGGHPIPLNVFETKLKTWKSSTYFLVDHQTIRGSISEETYEQLKEFLDSKMEQLVKHDTIEEARMHVQVWKMGGPRQIKIECYGMLGRMLI